MGRERWKDSGDLIGRHICFVFIPRRSSGKGVRLRVVIVEVSLYSQTGYVSSPL